MSDNVIISILFVAFLAVMGFFINKSSVASEKAAQEYILKYNCKVAGITNLGRDWNQPYYKCDSGVFTHKEISEK